MSFFIIFAKTQCLNYVHSLFLEKVCVHMEAIYDLRYRVNSGNTSECADICVYANFM